jgi:hypothetical protein
MRDPFRWPFIVALLALAASLFYGIRQHRVLMQERLGVAADRQALMDMDVRLKDSENARVAAETISKNQPGFSIRRLFSGTKAVQATGTIDKFNAAVDADPVWEPFYRKLEHRRILSRYNILLNALKIPPEKRVPLEDLLVQRAIASRTVVHQLRNAGRKLNSPEVLGAVSQATDDLDAKIKVLVGPDIAQQLKEWNIAIYSYGNAPDGQVAQDAVSLREAGFEVTTDQLVKLALIRYEVYVLNPGGRPGPISGADRIDPKTGLTRLESQLYSRDAEVLTPDEIVVLRNWTIEEHKARASLDALRAKFNIQPDK